MQPQRWQPTRLPRPWDSPGKNTGVGCHFLLQCIKVKSESEDTQPCPTLSDPMDCRPPGSSVHGIFQAKILEWGAIAFSGKLVLNGYKYILWLGNSPSGRNVYKYFMKDMYQNVQSSSVYNSPELETTLEKAMAPHSSTLAWRILWMEEPGKLQSMGLQESART